MLIWRLSPLMTLLRLVEAKHVLGIYWLRLQRVEYWAFTMPPSPPPDIPSNKRVTTSTAGFH